MFESCIEIRNHFSDYVDGLCEPEVQRSVRLHLKECPACARELDRLLTLQSDLRNLPRRSVPPELALRLKVSLSHQLHRRFLSRLGVRLDNALRPLLLPASAGVTTAVLCFGLILHSWITPTTKLSGTFVESVTPPKVRMLAPMNFAIGNRPVVLVTHIDAGGRVKDYTVVSGQSSPELIRHLDRMLFFSLFQPATAFGKPTDGQMVLSLRRITVRG